MIRGILFDLDGTLLDFKPAGDRAARAFLFHEGAQRSYAFLGAKGCALPTFEEYCRAQKAAFRWADWVTWLTGAEPDGRRALRRVCSELGLQRDQASLAKLGWLWYEPLAKSARLHAGVIPTLTALRDARIRLGLVVNTPHQGEVIDRHLDAERLLDFFSIRAYSSEIGVAKPHPRIFQTALEGVGLKAAETLFVGDDARADLVGARRAGMRTALRSASPTRRARRAADFVFSQIADLLDLPELCHARPQAAETTRAA
jgi:putative hydrolase of the HAD superfamily